MDGLRFAELREKNVERCEKVFHPEGGNTELKYSRLARIIPKESGEPGY